MWRGVRCRSRRKSSETGNGPLQANPQKEEATVSYRQPAQFTEMMIDAGEAKLNMHPKDMVIRGALAGGILAMAVAWAVTAAVQTGIFVVGAIVFPVGFAMLSLLGMDLVTGNFALSPLPLLQGRPGATVGKVLRNWIWVYIGNFLGSLLVAFLIAFVWTKGFTAAELPGPAKALVGASESRSLGFAANGAAGWWECFVRGILCNWMVSIGVVMAMTSETVVGKVAAMWLPIVIFFGLVFEHAVVNMFLFPIGMLLGAGFGIGDWMFWNQLPTTLGNIVGGMLFTGMTLYATHGPGKEPKPSSQPAPGAVAEG